jgi:DedD protein
MTFLNRTMFKSRPDSDTTTETPTVDVLRRQARHRLMGVAVLVLVAAVGFPMVFDTEPRPIAVDIPIVIPAQPVLAPLKPLTAAAPAPAPIPEPKPKPEQPPIPKPSPPPAKPSAPSAPASAAQATGERFVVQVGAYADAARAREVRLNIERTGLKTYAQVVNTAQGNRTRVRLGPFASRAEAEKTAKKLQSLGLSPSILSL